MAEDITMPQLGESVTEGTITKWLKQPGENINKYEPLCEVSTDKVNAEVPSTISGTVTEWVVQEGETVAVGQIICRIAAEGSEAVSSASIPDVVNSISDKQREGEADSSTDTSMKRRYSPAVLRLAQENGIDLEQVKGSGRGGRITRKDLIMVIESGSVKNLPSEAEPREEQGVSHRKVEVAAGSNNLSSIQMETGDQEISLTSVRRTIAQRMSTSKHEAPHAWTMVQADVTGLVQLRKKIKDNFKAREGISLTYLPFFIKAVADSLKEFPYLNAQWGGDKIILKKRINISVAVATDDALYVPVIHDADEKSIIGLAKSINRLAEKTRSGKLNMEDLSGGTFTVNNTGSFGSIASQPIINHPQAAIISMESIVRQPVVVKDMIAIRDRVNLCLSLDHRILDGLMAGRFLQRVKERLEAYGPETDI